MMIAIPASEWLIFGLMPTEQFCSNLQQWAYQVDLSRFSSHPRGQKKPPPERFHDPHRPHVSTARLLALASNSSKPP